MCDLCRALGSELDTLWHGDAQAVYGGAVDSAPAIAYANSVSQDTSVDPNIDGLLSGFKWSGTVTYSFTNSTSDYAPGYAEGMPLTGFIPVSTIEKQLIDKVMTYIEDITNLDIQRIDGSLDYTADIRIAKAPAANPTAFAYYPDNEPDGSGGDVWFGTLNSNGFGTPARGDYAYATHLHEIGHAFGLKHPHDTDTNPTAVPAADDGLEYSVMSYRSY